MNAQQFISVINNLPEITRKKVESSNKSDSCISIESNHSKRVNHDIYLDSVLQHYSKKYTHSNPFDTNNHLSIHTSSEGAEQSDPLPLPQRILERPPSKDKSNTSKKNVAGGSKPFFSEKGPRKYPKQKKKEGKKYTNQYYDGL